MDTENLSKKGYVLGVTALADMSHEEYKAQYLMNTNGLKNLMSNIGKIENTQTVKSEFLTGASNPTVQAVPTTLDLSNQFLPHQD